MIRLERLVFAGQYELRYFDCDSFGDFELQHSYSGLNFHHKTLHKYFSFGGTVSKVQVAFVNSYREFLIL